SAATPSPNGDSAPIPVTTTRVTRPPRRRCDRTDSRDLRHDDDAVDVIAVLGRDLVAVHTRRRARDRIEPARQPARRVTPRVTAAGRALDRDDPRAPDAPRDERARDTELGLGVAGAAPRRHALV